MQDFPNNPYDMVGDNYNIFKGGYLYDEESIKNHIKSKYKKKLQKNLSLISILFLSIAFCYIKLLRSFI